MLTIYHNHDVLQFLRMIRSLTIIDDRQRNACLKNNLMNIHVLYITETFMSS